MNGANIPVRTWLRQRRLPAIGWRAGTRLWPRTGQYLVEWLIILSVAYVYSGEALLDFDASQLQQTGEHNESATLPLLAEIGLRRYGDVPLWNPYMLTGFPHAGDFINHFWHPVSTLPILIWGGINGMKVSIFMAFVLAGLGQWWFAHVFGARGFVRLWAGILYMISGGLALLWRVGWYELLLGIAWFPWCFASLWWTLRRRDRSSVALTAICIAMVLTTGGGYYPIYLLVTLGVVAGMALLWARPDERWLRLGRSASVAVLSAGFTAVMLLPLIDGYRLTVREAGQDREQRFSQPIVYALINYVVSEPEWFRTEILRTAGGWNWFYIGAVPLAALALVPLAFSRVRWRRPALLTLAMLTGVILAWHANKHTPIKYIYEWIPVLYNLRFPNRLLILAASPLIVLGSLGLQYLFSASRLWSRGVVLTLASHDKSQTTTGISLRHALYGVWVLIMLFSLQEVYTVNKSFAFAPRPRNAKAQVALSWLKNYDPGLYYTQIGGGAVYWDWAPAAYEREMPIINFNYGRHLASQDEQRALGSLFIARPKYMLALPDQPRPDNAQLLHDFDGVGLWYLPDALPFAFSAQPALLQPYAVLASQDAAPLQVRLDGPNRVVVRGQPARAGDQLVVLVSNYPGWQLFIDGRLAPLAPANHYLGAAMLPGEHNYVFEFRPMLYYIGLGVSLLTFAVILYWLFADLRVWLAQSWSAYPVAQS